ncbi:MAG: DUF4476 domain-containing protein [Myxococcota bacterium]
MKNALAISVRRAARPLTALMVGLLALSSPCLDASAAGAKPAATAKPTPKPAPAPVAEPTMQDPVVVDRAALQPSIDLLNDQIVLMEKELEQNPVLAKKLSVRLNASRQALKQLQQALITAQPPNISVNMAVGPMGGGVGAGMAVGPNGASVSAGGMAGPMGGGVSAGVAVGPNGGMVAGGVVNGPGPGAPVVVMHGQPAPTAYNTVDPRGTVVVVQASPTAPAPAPVAVAPAEVRRAISEGDLQSIITSINEESFSQGKMQVLKTAGPSYWFTVDQVKRIIGTFTFENDKLAAVEFLAPRILDRENAHKLYSAFDFQSSKDKVAEILRR